MQANSSLIYMDLPDKLLKKSRHSLISSAPSLVSIALWRNQLAISSRIKILAQTLQLRTKVTLCRAERSGKAQYSMRRFARLTDRHLGTESAWSLGPRVYPSPARTEVRSNAIVCCIVLRRCSNIVTGLCPNPKR